MPFAISAGTVYPLLSRLKKAGVIDSTWQESPVGPPRKYYRVSDAGAVLLDRRRPQWDEFSSAVSQILKRGDKR